MKAFHSPDADLESFWPDDPEDFGLLVELLVGPVDGPGEESFGVLVCTPGWLGRRVREEGAIWGHFHLIVESYDWPRTRELLRRAVESKEGADWSELAEKIARVGRWEFEDYTA